MHNYQNDFFFKITYLLAFAVERTFNSNTYTLNEGNVLEKTKKLQDLRKKYLKNYAHNDVRKSI